MSTTTALDLDENGDVVHLREYRSMIESLLYVTVTRSDIPFAVSVCALLGFPTLFTSDNHSVDLQVSQIHTRVWDLVFCFFIA
jgi:hypothetical protein